MPRTRRRFTAEFKAEAVKLLEESGRPLQMIAEELGIHPAFPRWGGPQLTFFADLVIRIRDIAAA